MWYFTWILGVTAAIAIGVINVMWYEFQDNLDGNGAAAEPERAPVE
ncbi:Cytochrome bd-I oxidase subunit CydX [Methylocella tundrae]|uniref:Cytochrome bd-I oxidase subunit CydX n=1 Tax=Methylocella tundrae TaxID=227605 RepID=A0A4U8Z7E9_METTU|nr:cytochrome bd-I oxidase subunit CydX [Methylocella tundrae]WPP03023.1 cytochrome bd-I oxidase subunit CydX [Methylocella tundrae]VFU16794.1 Cytochrome bd-I oxidase subunit CydX [Methylocella tundrae]VTZ27374.1 Cytochrome bd-I oxidase subunit CydX [Methylocella tundrae]VTZ51923.1 Cytochrome bd-I oxidase subunit CydX [Methylocella tundrae]